MSINWTVCIVCVVLCLFVCLFVYFVCLLLFYLFDVEHVIQKVYFMLENSLVFVVIVLMKIGIVVMLVVGKKEQ